MSQTYSTYSKLSNASAKLSNNRRIFTKSNLPNQGNDLFRIAAKIRELEDDVKAILGENQQIEENNKELIRVLQELEYVVNVQQMRVDELTKCLRKDLEASQSIAQYEDDLRTVAEQINTLNELIRTKNDQFQILKSEKEDLLYDNIKLKEQSNVLLYTENTYHQELDLLLQDNEDEPHTFNEDLEHKMQVIFGRCDNLANQIQKLKKEIDQSKRSSNEKLIVDKQKRIKLEFQIKLLRERKSDQVKKENYFKGFYDEERIQEVIDDLLKKEDALRRQIAEQEEANQQLIEDWEQEIEEYQSNANREKNQREEQARLLNMEIQMLSKKLEDHHVSYSEITKTLEISQSEGIQMTKFQEEMDSELWQRIKATEEENLRLQQQYQQLAGEVAFLEKEMAI